MKHMFLMCKIPWHYTGDAKMEKNSFYPPEARSLIKDRHANKITAI